MVDQNKIEEWLKNKVPQLSCPCCGHKQTLSLFPSYQPQYYSGTNLYVTPPKPAPAFELNNDISMTLRLSDDKFIDYLSGIPMISLVCVNCGYVMFFSAKKLGII